MGSVSRLDRGATAIWSSPPCKENCINPFCFILFSYLPCPLHSWPMSSAANHAPVTLYSRQYTVLRCAGGRMYIGMSERARACPSVTCPAAHPLFPISPFPIPFSYTVITAGTPPPPSTAIVCPSPELLFVWTLVSTLVVADAGCLNRILHMHMQGLDGADQS